VRRLADGVQAKRCLRAVRTGEGPWLRDRMRWVHRATRFGEAAAPRGMDRAQRSGMTKQGTDGRGLGPGGVGLVVSPVQRLEWAAAGACGPRVTGAEWSHVTDGPGPVWESHAWCMGGSHVVLSERRDVEETERVHMGVGNG
jgi:hypothetical protein